MSQIDKFSQDREARINYAIEREDWATLREISLLPGGFGSMLRWRTWLYLLGVSLEENDLSETSSEVSTSIGLGSARDIDSTSSTAASMNAEEDRPHPDERQVGLDTNRSFVIYPEIEGQLERDAKKSQLNQLIVTVLRKRRQLNYFQGYHDVASVLYLTENSEKSARTSDLSPALFSALEKMSLHRVRDSMGIGLDPLVGFMRIFKRLLRAEDADLAKIVEGSPPQLPYFALSNLLTLLSHDIPTLPLIQRTFDFLLCRPPEYVIYLSAAMVLKRKDIVMKMAEEDEGGMMHSILSDLPEMHADGMEEEERERRSSSMTVDEAGSSRSPSRDSHQNVTKVPPESWERLSHELESSQSSILSDLKPDDTASEATRAPSFSTSEGASSTKSSSPSPAVTNLPPESHQPPMDSTGIPISVILQEAEDLYQRYPPSHTSIKASEIMGPNSVIFTWKGQVGTSSTPGESDVAGNKSAYFATRPNLPSDDEAENMVSDTHSIVYPYDPSEEESLEEEYPPPANPIKKRRIFIEIDRKTALAGIVLLLGVGIAVYTTADRRSVQGLGKEWKKVVGWAGSILLSGVGHGFEDEF